MIDTIKIYAGVTKDIYNVIHYYSNIKTSYNYSSGEIFYEIITDSLEGSYSSNISVRSSCASKYRLLGFDYVVEIEGSYHKYKNGFNSHNGYYDLQAIVQALISEVNNKYNIKLPGIENWYLQRADVAICYDLSTQENICTYINNLSKCSFPRRKMKFYQNESIYLSGTTTTLKIYNKMLEFRKHDIKKFVETDFDLVNYLNHIKGFIRFECEVKKKKLLAFYNKDNIKVIDVKYDDLKKIWSDEFMKLLNLVDYEMKIVTDREDVFVRLNTFYKPVKARNLYNFFLLLKLEGVQGTKSKMSSTSYYRNIADLKKCNIDFSQKYNVTETENIIYFNPFECEEVS